MNISRIVDFPIKKRGVRDRLITAQCAQLHAVLLESPHQEGKKDATWKF